MQLVVAKVIFSVVENLPGVLCACKRRVQISRNNGRVIDEIEEAAGMLSQNDLLLSTLNCCCEVGVVCLLEFLTSLCVINLLLELHCLATLTMLVSCASATKLWASARTSSCSS
jgi:hypothetical protein